LLFSLPIHKEDMVLDTHKDVHLMMQSHNIYQNLITYLYLRWISNTIFTKISVILVYVI
jgi:hypothetical protein